MAADGSFLVEDFLGAITSQLDRTQDALALRNLNRPVNYAIKDFSLELKVFVDIDPEGRVRFRSPGANEPGASTVSIGFTTMTRSMVQENTVETSAARSPSLAQSGLSDAERQRLERVGVRTAAELQRLRQSTGTDGLSRIADIPVDRLRQALTFGRPQVRGVRPAAPPTPPPAVGAPVAQPPRAAQPVVAPVPAPPAAAPGPRVVTLPPTVRRLEFTGRNLLGPQGAPSVRLGGTQLAVAEAEEERFVVEIPGGALAGTLEVDHGDGEVPETYELALQADPWAAVEA